MEGMLVQWKVEHKKCPPLKCLGQNTAFCDRHTYLSLVTTISTWAFGQQACMIYIINKLFSRASSVLVTINSPIHRKVQQNGKPLAAAYSARKKTSVGFLFAGSLANIAQYLPHCNFFNPKKLPTTIESIVAFKLPETTTTPMKIGLVFQPLMSRGA